MEVSGAKVPSLGKVVTRLAAPINSADQILRGPRGATGLTVSLGVVNPRPPHGGSETSPDIDIKRFGMRTGLRGITFVWRAWPVTLAAIGLAIGFVAWSKVARFLPARTPMTIEYSIENGRGAPTREYTKYYRFDGAEATERRTLSSPEGVFRPLYAVYLPLQAIWMNVDPETHLVFSRRITGEEVYRLRGRRVARTDSIGACLSELVAFLGPGNDRGCRHADGPILGYKVWKTHAVVGPPGKPITFESYLAPGLDWHMLRQDQFADNKLLGRIVAVRVIRANPSDKLFRAGKDAKPATLIEFARRSRELRHLPECKECESAGAGSFARNTNLVAPVY